MSKEAGIGEGLFACFAWFLIMCIDLPLCMFGAVPVMIALGIFHGVWHAVPDFGFWATTAILWASRVAFPYRVKVDKPK